MPNAIAEAFRHGRDLLDSRDGAGFIFRVETVTGRVVEGPPPDTDDLNDKNRDFVTIERGNGIFAVIPLRVINLIEVVEC